MLEASRYVNDVLVWRVSVDPATKNGTVESTVDGITTIYTRTWDADTEQAVITDADGNTVKPLETAWIMDLDLPSSPPPELPDEQPEPEQLEPELTESVLSLSNEPPVNRDEFNIPAEDEA